MLAQCELMEGTLMPSGGARNRSGSPADPGSLRSAKRGLVFTALPSEGFTGEVPAFPLPRRSVYRSESEDGRRFQVFDEDETERVAERELELWSWAWSTPQACAWAERGEAWRLPTVAIWVRTFVLCESSEATAADKNSLHRFADQIGLTPAGLRENGWAVAADRVGQKRDEAETTKPQPSSRDRMTVVNGGGGG